MSDRELDVTKFSYKSYRKLKTSLGEFDAVVECNELAIGEFIFNFKNDGDKYIKKLSRKHKIKVHTVGIEKFTSRIRGYYISSVFQQSEQFLGDFKEEWSGYFSDRKWIEREKGQTVLDNTLNVVGLTLPQDLLCIYEYYRLVRNYMSHTDRDVNDIVRLHKKIHENHGKFLGGINILRSPSTPNTVGHIEFDDFMMLTNIIKHIAFKICQASKPSNNQVANVLLKKINASPRTLAGIKKLKNDPLRYQKAIKSYMFTEHGRFSDADATEVAELLIDLLA